MKIKTLFLGHDNLEPAALKKRKWNLLAQQNIKLLATQFGVFRAIASDRHGVTFAPINEAPTCAN